MLSNTLSVIWWSWWSGLATRKTLSLIAAACWADLWIGNDFIAIGIEILNSTNGNGAFALAMVLFSTGVAATFHSGISVGSNRGLNDCKNIFGQSKQVWGILPLLTKNESKANSDRWMKRRCRSCPYRKRAENGQQLVVKRCQKGLTRSGNA